MKASQLRMIGLGTVLLLGAGFALWHFMLKPKPVPLALTVLQTRAASETKDLQSLFNVYAQKHPQMTITVSYMDSKAVRDKAGTGLLPAFDLLLTDSTTAGRLDEHKEIMEWADTSDEATRKTALPLYEEGFQVLFYNKKLAPTPPETWGDLVGQTVAQASPSQMRYGLAMPEEAFALLPFVSRAFFNEQGGPMKTMESTLIREGVETVRTLRQTFSLTPRDCSAECAAQVFLAGQAPFAMAGEWRWREFAAKLGPDFGIAALPRLESGESVSARSTVYLAGSRSTPGENIPFITELRNYLQGAEGSKEIFTQLGKVPTSYVFKTLQPDTVEAQALVNIIQKSTVGVDEDIFLLMLARLKPAIQEYFSGLITAAELVERLGQPQAET
ncbi:MAG: extracellular solute-binding protein [Pseudobdellovibrionaceae bacterium]|nr:extracellular solute-binding protein [Pseudobdellovibrionaceae bacterium]